MRKSITLRSFPAHLDTAGRVEMAARAGFQGVEVNLEPSEEYSLESTDRELLALRKCVEDAGLAVSAANSREQWKYPITSADRETRARGKQVIERLLRSAATLGAGAVLTIPGGVDLGLFAAKPEIVRYDDAYKRSLDALRELAHETAERCEVYMAVENVWNKFLLSPLEFAEYVDQFKSPWVRAYLDVGNMVLYGYPQDWIRTLGRRTVKVHFKDFKFEKGRTEWTALREGQIDWPAVMRAFREVGYTGTASVELPGGDEAYLREVSRRVDLILSGA